MHKKSHYCGAISSGKPRYILTPQIKSSSGQVINALLTNICKNGVIVEVMKSSSTLVELSFEHTSHDVMESLA